MGFLQRLFGGGEPEQDRRPAPRGRSGSGAAGTPDEQAVERYRYMLRTAPPEAIEEAHAEAFAQLTPEQRQMVLAELSEDLPERERAAAGDDPRALARMATRTEMRRPGTLERTFGNMGPAGGGVGLGGLMAGSFLSSFAGIFVGSAIAQQFFDDNGDGSDQGGDGSEGDGGGAGGADTGGAEGDAGGGDVGGGFDGGGFGGDFGGGDFGGEF